MSARSMSEEVVRLTMLRLKHLGTSSRLKVDLDDLGDKCVKAAKVINELIKEQSISNEYYTGQLKSANDRIGNLLAENAILKQQLKIRKAH